jgi:hypothetical protein
MISSSCDRALLPGPWKFATFDFREDAPHHVHWDPVRHANRPASDPKNLPSKRCSPGIMPRDESTTPRCWFCCLPSRLDDLYYSLCALESLSLLSLILSLQRRPGHHFTLQCFSIIMSKLTELHYVLLKDYHFGYTSPIYSDYAFRQGGRAIRPSPLQVKGGAGKIWPVIDCCLNYVKGPPLREQTPGLFPCTIMPQ